MYVKWDMDIDADTTLEAAEKARDAQVRNGTIATIFEVTDDEGNVTSVDLSEESEISDSLCVLISGNPVDGFRFIGPFRNGEVANLYADDNLDADWWNASLDAPND